MPKSSFSGWDHGIMTRLMQLADRVSATYIMNSMLQNSDACMCAILFLETYCCEGLTSNVHEDSQIGWVTLPSQKGIYNFG